MRFVFVAGGSEEIVELASDRVRGLVGGIPLADALLNELTFLLRGEFAVSVHSGETIMY